MNIFIHHFLVGAAGSAPHTHWCVVCSSCWFSFLSFFCIIYFMQELLKTISGRTFNFLFLKIPVYYPQRSLSELVLHLGIDKRSLLKWCITKTPLLSLVLLLRGQILSLTFSPYFSVINRQIWTKNAYNQSILLRSPYTFNTCHMEVETTLCSHL